MRKKERLETMLKEKRTNRVLPKRLEVWNCGKCRMVLNRMYVVPNGVLQENVRIQVNKCFESRDSGGPSLRRCINCGFDSS